MKSSRIGIVLGVLAYARMANAQAPAGTPICLPGTTVCGWADGRGGIRVDAAGSAHVGADGANASANAHGAANADARGNGRSSGSGEAGERSGGGTHYHHYTGRFGVGVVGCPIARVGVWSGYKAGGCAGVSFRFEALTFEMESQLLYGGTTHAFDWTFPLSFNIPLANEKSLFEGGYLRFGGSPVGATFARKQDGGGFVRFGLFAGAGYEVQLSDRVVWRVIDGRVSFDMGTRRAMDRLQNWLDLGFQLGTGIIL